MSVKRILRVVQTETTRSVPSRVFDPNPFLGLELSPGNRTLRPLTCTSLIDNYGTHKHEKVQEWLRRRPRFHLHFTPTGSSWLNLVERFFGELTQDVLQEGSFTSVSWLATSRVT